MARVAIAHEGFVMAAAGAQRPRPAGVAIVFGTDVAAPQKIALLRFVDARGNVSQRVRIGIHKAMARSDVSRRPHAQQPQARAARMRFVHALAQFRQRIADVRESVRLAAQRIFQIFVSQRVELIQHAVHARSH